ncbi:hypothetical protein BH23THE1_BH23THE1_30550 [soil metagenome]
MWGVKQIFPTRPARYRSAAPILISILYLVGLIDWSSSSNSFVNSGQKKRRGRPYVYSPTIILRCFIVRIWFRLDSNRSALFLCLDLPYNKRIMKACGLSVSYLPSPPPSRRTFDRRLKTTSTV